MPIWARCNAVTMSQRLPRTIRPSVCCCQSSAAIAFPFEMGRDLFSDGGCCPKTRGESLAALCTSPLVALRFSSANSFHARRVLNPEAKQQLSAARFTLRVARIYQGATERNKSVTPLPTAERCISLGTPGRSLDKLQEVALRHCGALGVQRSKVPALVSALLHSKCSSYLWSVRCVACARITCIALRSSRPGR